MRIFVVSTLFADLVQPSSPDDIYLIEGVVQQLIQTLVDLGDQLTGPVGTAKQLPESTPLVQIEHGWASGPSRVGWVEDQRLRQEAQTSLDQTKL